MSHILLFIVLALKENCTDAISFLEPLELQDSRFDNEQIKAACRTKHLVQRKCQQTFRRSYLDMRVTGSIPLFILGDPSAFTSQKGNIVRPACGSTLGSLPSWQCPKAPKPKGRRSGGGTSTDSFLCKGATLSYPG
ncbi:hypothetical protein CHARACLAT_009413 [Characodon lateralis]|uniref:Uncharacterized protein n=1 Tax=Characodon lateralis TaxID=208331 RepID=A0ABU7ESS2_9TELE|nr:hypothetical protein [Characodon lateralis]